jgi:hypothetical protein
MGFKSGFILCLVMAVATPQVIAAKKAVKIPEDVMQYVVEARQCRIAIFQAEPDEMKLLINIKFLREKHCGKAIYERGQDFLVRYKDNMEIGTIIYEVWADLREASLPCPD